MHLPDHDDGGDDDGSRGDTTNHIDLEADGMYPGDDNDEDPAQDPSQPDESQKALYTELAKFGALKSKSAMVSRSVRLCGL